MKSPTTLTATAFGERLKFHESIETMEVDFTGMTFASDADVDRVYDEIDQRAAEAAEYLTGTEVAIHVDLGTGGPARARMWTCDLSAEYVRINGEYRT